MNNFTSFPNKLWSLVFVLALTSMGVKLSAQIQINLDLQKPTCNGYTNGSATASATGGQAPYSYQWSVGTAGGQAAWSLTGGDYSLTVTDANGLTAVKSFTLQQPDPITGSIQLLGDPCTSDSYAANGQGGTPNYSYQWNTGETTATIQNPNVADLSVTITDVFGCSSAAAAPVNNPLQATADLSDITCNGYNDGVGVVNATGGQPPYSFLWSTGSTDVYISGLSAGDYSVTVIDAAGCTSVASGTIANPPATQVTITKDPECGVPATATAFATGGVEPYMFMWINNGQLISTDSFFTFTEPGTMYLCVMNGNHCPHDNWVTVGPGFDLNANVIDKDCNGTGGSIDLMPSTVVGPVTYNWTGPTGFVDPHTEDLNNLEPGTYSVTATDAAGCSATYTATVGENAMSADFDFALMGCNNNVLDVAFTASPNDPNATYDWSFSGNQQQQTAQFTSNPGTVTLNVSFANGCTASVTKPVDLDVIDVSVPSAQTACMGDALQINVQNNNGSTIDYAWTPASLIQSGANTANPVLNTNLAGNHTLEVQMTNASGCVVTETVALDVSDPAAFALDQSLLSYNQCEGFKLDLQNTNTNASDYHWVFPDGTSSIDSNTNFDFASQGMGTYNVMLVPNDTTCANPIPYEVVVGQEAKVDFDFNYIGCIDSIQFVDLSTAPHPISSWTWEFPTEYKTQSPTIPAGVVNSADFMAKLTIEFPTGCSLSLEKPIAFNAIQDVHIPDSLLICGQEGVSLNPGGNTAYQYTWSPPTGLDDASSADPLATPSTTKVYTVDIVNVNGPDSCMVTKEVTVVVAPITVAAAGDTTVCDNQAQVQLNATHTGDDLNWYDDPSLATSIGMDATIMVNPGTYYAVSTNAEGCQKVDTVEVALNPVAMAITQDEFTLCMGEDASLEIDAVQAGENVNWYLDNTLVGTGSPLVVNPTNSGTYVAVVTNADGCSATDTAQVDVIDISVDVAASENPIYRSQTTELEATGGFVSYQWTPDDGTLDDINVANPVANPQETTTYTVLVTDTNGCTTERSITIEVKETECGEPYIYLPNAFSPNGDGQNEVLYLRGLNLSEIHLSIYNRWGQEVFDTRNQGVGWDGTFNGEPVVPDVYGFYLRVKCDNGEKYFKKGNITVLK